MSRTVGWVSAVIAVQIAAIVIFGLIESNRSHSQRTDASRSTEPPTPLDLPMPPITARRHDGTRMDWSSVSRPTLVHIWATWCPPCREELPVLLELPETHEVDVVAISADENWSAVERFVDDIDRSKIFLGNAREIDQLLNVKRLPVTFLLRPDDHIVLRFDGVQDWTNTALIARLLKTDSAKPSSPDP